MTAALSDTWALTARDLLRLVRQPWFVAIVLVQPIIWLLLFGELFQSVVEIPGFGIYRNEPDSRCYAKDLTGA